MSGIKVRSFQGSVHIPIAYEINEQGCFICISHKPDKKGYPNYRFNQKRWRMHRYIYLTQKGEIPEGMCVCHSCDNPTCINPAHLFLGTIKDNTMDMVRKGRQAKGERINLAKLNEEIVRLIKSSTEKRPVLARRFSVSVQTITDIRKGKSWKYVRVPA